MNLIYYFNYNNYINRTIKGHATLSEYLNDSNCEYLCRSNTVNFNKTNDKEATIDGYIDENGVPDYAIVVKENLEIVSRWFVINEIRKNKGNYRLELKRDLVYDNYSKVLFNLDTLIKRGYAPINDISILNDEKEFNFNEYKHKEIKLDNISRNSKGWIALFVGNKLKEKLDTDTTATTQEIYSSRIINNIVSFYSSSTGERIISSSPKNKGYNMILIPYAVFENPSYHVETKYSGNSLSYEYDGNSISPSFNGYDVIQFLNTNVITNETFIDIQIIPDINGIVDYTVDENSSKITIEIENGNQNVLGFTTGVIATCFPIVSQSEFEYTRSVSLVELGIASDPLDATRFQDNPKLLEAYKLYLESPDRTSNFKIDLRKFINKTTNTIDISFTFNIKLLYQPFQSFMYVYPDTTDNYFGSSEIDGRFLLCGYNNQLLRTTDVWLSFLLNNKNYLNSFNLEMRDAKINTATSAITGAIGGATTGALVGSVVPVLGTAVGAIAGAVVGGTTAVVQGIINTDEKRKQFEWNCDNLQSRPQSVSKVASFVPSNSIFPTLSIYYNERVVENTTGTFDRYLELNGYTINQIGYIAKFLKPHSTTFISAEILKLESFKGSADELLEIQTELEKGLYIVSE